MAQDIVAKIQAAAQASGVDPDVALRIAGVESSFRPAAKNPESTAAGLFQVTGPTWKQYGGKPGKQRDVDENIRVGMKILSSNKASMQEFLGREPLPSDIYAAHFFGPTGARAVMSADPLAPVASVVSKQVMEANPQLVGKTVNEVLTGYRQTFDKGGKRYPTSEPVKTTTVGQGTRTMDQEAGAAAPALSNRSSARDRIAGMGSNYQAALAAMMLGEASDEDDKDDDTDTPKEAYTAPTAANALSELDLGRTASPFDAMEPAVQPEGAKYPMRFAKGGEASAPITVDNVTGFLSDMAVPAVLGAINPALGKAYSLYSAYNTVSDFANEAQPPAPVVSLNEAVTEAGKTTPFGARSFMPSGPAPVVSAQDHGIISVPASGSEHWGGTPSPAPAPAPAPSTDYGSINDFGGSGPSVGAATDSGFDAGFGFGMGFAEGGEASTDDYPGLKDLEGYAIRASEQMFPTEVGQDDRRDAARHMLAAAVAAQKVGPGAAEFLGKAHERLSNAESFFNMFGVGEPRYDYDMDVQNNRIGIGLADQATSREELEALVKQMAQRTSTSRNPNLPWTMDQEQRDALIEDRKRRLETPQYKNDGGEMVADETFSGDFEGYKALNPRAVEEAIYRSRNLTKKTDPDSWPSPGNPRRSIPNEPRDYPTRAGQELLEFLKQADRMPTVVEPRRYPNGSYDAPGFTYRSNNPEDRGVVEVPTFTKDGYGTLVHELTHSADRAMDVEQLRLSQKVRAGEPLTPKEQRFYDGYSKLYKTKTNLPLDISDESTSDRQRRYRTSAKELRAFGTGNMAQDQPEPGRYSLEDIGATLNPHVDPTMAQEAAIMRDLYLRRGEVRGRAEGSPPEGEYADPEAAFMAGAGDAPAPNAENAAAALAALRGLGEYPYNLVGGGVDLAAMAMRPFGYDVEKPVLGSDWIKEKATQLGIRPPEETDPTLRDIRMGTEIATSVLDPSAGARAVGSTLRGAGELATSEPARAMLNRAMEAGGSGPMYAVRPPGGVMIQQPAQITTDVTDGGFRIIPAGGVEGALRPADDVIGGLDQMMDTAILQTTLETENPEVFKAVSDFLMTKGRQYFSKNYASTKDPIYDALKDGRIKPLPDDERGFRSYMLAAAREGDPEALTDLVSRYDKGIKGYVDDKKPGGIDSRPATLDLRAKAQEAAARSGLLPEEVTVDEDVFRLFDASPFSHPRKAIKAGIPEVLEASKYDEPIFDMAGYEVPSFMSPKVVAQELVNIPVDKLQKMSYPEAVIAVNKNLRFKEDLNAAMERVRQGKDVPKEIMLFGTSPVKTATENSNLGWVKLTDSRATAMEGEAMGHSVGGYNRLGGYNAGGKEAFDSGVAEIYSLRDKKGRPVATVEVQNLPGGPQGNTERVVTDIRGKYNSRPPDDKAIFELFDQIKPTSVRKKAYVRDRNNEPLEDSVFADWDTDYAEWRLGNPQGFAKGGLVERNVYNHQKYL